MVSFIIIFLLSIYFWVMAYSEKARAAMPEIWIGRASMRKRLVKRTEDERLMQEGFTLGFYLVAAMVSSVLWIAILVFSIVRYVKPEI